MIIEEINVGMTRKGLKGPGEGALPLTALIRTGVQGIWRPKLLRSNWVQSKN